MKYVMEIRRRHFFFSERKYNIRRLERLGFEGYKPVSNYGRIIRFEKVIDESEVRREKKRIRRAGYKARWYEVAYKRNRGARKAFLAAHPDVHKFRCVYCGRKVSAAGMEVDHLIPVSVAQKSKHYQRELKKLGCDTVNDLNNLVPACIRCNRKKGNKTGLWYLSGRLGSIPHFFLIRNIVLALIAIALIIAAYAAFT